MRAQQPLEILPGGEQERLTVDPPQPAQTEAAHAVPVFAFCPALAFYELLGFRIGYRDDSFALIERDGVVLHLNRDPDLPPGRHFVCYITVSESEALYRHYRHHLPSGRIRGQLRVTPYGTQEFWICDPFNNILIFAEPIAAQDGDASS